MKYESNILKRLIDTYGVVGNPRYISEIIKEFIVQGKERFPNLFTYQADWLAHIDEFGLNPSYFVSYTGQSIYAPNTLERPVKRAILKGQTENICDKFEQGSYQFSTSAGTITPTTPTNNRIRIKQPITGVNTLFKMTVNGNYQILLAVKDKDGRVTGTDWVNEINKKLVETDKLYFVLRKKDGTNITPNDLYTAITSVTGYDLFEMKYVRMPVLTTRGKNLFDKNKLEEGDFSSVGIPTQSQSRCRTSDFIQVESGSKITLSKSTTEWFKVFGYDNNKNFICIVLDRNSSRETFTIPSNVCFIKIKFDYSIDIAIDDNIQLECDTQATPYEPFKSNILTVNEEVELRGIGDVKDTLDLLTGEVIERVGETRFNGDFSWELREVGESYTTFRLAKTSISSNMVTTNSHNRPTDYVCNALNVVSSNNGAGEFECIWFSDGHVYIRLSKDKATTIDGLKQYLNFNDITIQYLLKNEFIKTVDLSILDQNGQNIKQLMSFSGGTHFNTGSLEGSLLPVVSVSVDTDLEETLRVCSLEGNTM